jgi:RNA polymerase sigma-70 factor (ECF subfamily)
MNTTHAIDAAYASYRTPIVELLAQLLGDQEAAEDLCQDTFVQALREWPPSEDIGDVQAWLEGLAERIAHDYLRAKQHTRSFEGLADDVAAVGWEDVVVEAATVQQALATLKPAYRAVLVMNSCDRASMRDIARTLGCTPNTVQLRLWRGRTCFRAAFAALN